MRVLISSTSGFSWLDLRLLRSLCSTQLISGQLGDVSQPVSIFTVYCVKISITLANRRMTGLTSRKWRIFCWTYLALLICLAFMSITLYIFRFSPAVVSFSLKAVGELPDTVTISCLAHLDGSEVVIFMRYTHMLTDLILLPLPLIIIGKLQISFSRKIRLILVFLLGLVSIIACIVRNALIERKAPGADGTCRIALCHGRNNSLC